MKTTPEIRIDRTKTLVEEPGTGHNRWHPDIPPVIHCDPGDDVILRPVTPSTANWAPPPRGTTSPPRTSTWCTP